MANHFNILTWKIPWTEESGKLQSKGLQRVGHDWPQHSTYYNPVDYMLTFRFMLTREIAQSVRMDAINGYIVQRRKVRHRDVK